MAPDTPDLLDLVRSRCAEVAAEARSVHILDERIASYAKELGEAAAGTDPTDPARHDVTDDTETHCLFVLSLDAINFGSGWFPVLAKRPGRSGYHTIADGLADHVRSTGLTVMDLRSVDREAMARITGQDPDGAGQVLLDQFVHSWQELGRLLDDSAGGSAIDFVAAADGSAARLVAALDAGHALYRDAPDYDGEPVPLYKRAQITVADLHLAFAGEGPGRFADLDRLTMFADNLVPHVLRLDGVLTFCDELVDRIDAGDLLEPGEPAEVEIRAVAVHAVEQLVDALTEAGRPMTAMELDAMLWHRGAGDRYKTRRRHRCRTTAY
jgi:hypothetical protein